MTIDTEDRWEAQAAALAALSDAFDAAVPAVAGFARGLGFSGSSGLVIRCRCRTPVGGPTPPLTTSF